MSRPGNTVARRLNRCRAAPPVSRPLINLVQCIGCQSNKIALIGLDFCFKWSVAVDAEGAKPASDDRPAGSWPLRGRGGATDGVAHLGGPNGKISSEIPISLQI